MRPLWICGFPRSGSTIVQSVLDSSPNISCTNEQSYIHLMHDVYRMACPRIHTEAFSLPRQDFELLLQQIKKHWPKAFWDYHKLRKPKAEVCGDKLPAQIKYIDWIRDWFPDSKFIITYRNKKSCVESMRKNIIDYQDKHEKYAVNAYNNYQMLFDQQKDKEDVLQVNLDEITKDNVNNLFNKISKFLDVDTQFNIDLVV